MIIGANVAHLNTGISKADMAAVPEKNAELPKDSVQLGNAPGEPKAQDTVKHSKDAEEIAKRMVGTDGKEIDFIYASGTDGDDNITIKKAPNLSIAVNVNGKETVYGFGDSRNLIIDGGKGNDRIVADKDVGLMMYITGGEGNDYIVGGSHMDMIIDNYGSNTIKGGGEDDIIIARGLDYKPGENTPPGGIGKMISGQMIDGNIIVGGEGDDYIEGGKGNDLISGGSGNDSIYGMSGNDLIAASSGNDYVDAGLGNDVVRSQSGKNVLFGGQGDDCIQGGKDRDVVVGGQGKDTLSAGKGKNIITASSGSSVEKGEEDQVTTLDPASIPQNILVSGDEAYQERVGGDLDFIASVGIGQNMLDGIKNANNKVVVAGYMGGNRCASDATAKLKEDGTPNVGSDAVVKYDETRVSSHSLSPWADRPPVVGLYHEMVHGYNAVNGTMDPKSYTYEGKVVQGGVPGVEFQAVGIDNGAVKQNPEGVSENAMRDLMGLMKRESY